MNKLESPLSKLALNLHFIKEADFCAAAETHFADIIKPTMGIGDRQQVFHNLYDAALTYVIFLGHTGHAKFYRQDIAEKADAAFEGFAVCIDGLSAACVENNSSQKVIAHLFDVTERTNDEQGAALQEKAYTIPTITKKSARQELRA